MIEPVYILTCISCGKHIVVSMSEYMTLEYKSARVPCNHPTVSDYLNIVSDCCCTPNYAESRGYKTRIYFGETRATLQYNNYSDMFFGSDDLEKQTVHTFEKAVNIEYNNQIIGIAMELSHSNCGYGCVDAVLKSNDESFINKRYNLSITGDELLILEDK